MISLKISPCIPWNIFLPKVSLREISSAISLRRTKYAKKWLLQVPNTKSNFHRLLRLRTFWNPSEDSDNSGSRTVIIKETYAFCLSPVSMGMNVWYAFNVLNLKVASSSNQYRINNRYDRRLMSMITKQRGSSQWHVHTYHSWKGLILHFAQSMVKP